MLSSQPDMPDQSRADGSDGDGDSHAAGDPVLARVKEVAQSIVKRVRQAAEDTDLDLRALPDDPTEEASPVT